MAQQPLVGQVVLDMEDSESHSDTLHSVGLLSLSHQSDAETSPENTTQGANIRAPSWIQTRNPSKRRSQTRTLEGAVTGIGHSLNFVLEIKDIINTGI